MNPLDLIHIYYRPGSLAYEVLLGHSTAVAKTALGVAGQVKELKPDAVFIREAAMLHDIGIFEVNAPEIGCFGKLAYVCHGWLGAQILERHGMARHARVCERHVGTGMSAQEIADQKLPLPVRDMLPETIEEQIICYADLFFSKTPPPKGTRRDAAGVINWLKPWGQQRVERFLAWQEMFGKII